VTDEDSRIAALAQADYLLRAALDLLCAMMPECVAYSIVDQICEDHAQGRIDSGELTGAINAPTSAVKH